MALSKKVNFYTTDPSLARFMQKYPRQYESMASTISCKGAKPIYEFYGLDLVELQEFLPKIHSRMSIDSNYTICNASDGLPIRGRVGRMDLRAHDVLAVVNLQRGGASWN